MAQLRKDDLGFGHLLLQLRLRCPSRVVHVPSIRLKALTETVSFGPQDSPASAVIIEMRIQKEDK